MIDPVIRIAAVIAITAAQTGPALACACCADPGARYERSDILTDWDFTALETLRSDGIVEVHFTDCGDECILGLTQIGDWHDSTFLAGQSGVVLTVGAAGGDAPAITLTAGPPDQFDWLASDPAPGSRRITPGGLYSEITIPLTMTATGPSWTGGDAAFPARLILIGQSTACMDASRATHWMLDVGTQELSFRLFGRFDPPDYG